MFTFTVKMQQQMTHAEYRLLVNHLVSYFAQRGILYGRRRPSGTIVWTIQEPNEDNLLQVRRAMIPDVAYTQEQLRWDMVGFFHGYLSTLGFIGETRLHSQLPAAEDSYWTHAHPQGAPDDDNVG